MHARGHTYTTEGEHDRQIRSGPQVVAMCGLQASTDAGNKTNTQNIRTPKHTPLTRADQALAERQNLVRHAERKAVRIRIDATSRERVHLQPAHQHPQTHNTRITTPWQPASVMAEGKKTCPPKTYGGLQRNTGRARTVHVHAPSTCAGVGRRWGVVWHVSAACTRSVDASCVPS